MADVNGKVDNTTEETVNNEIKVDYVEETKTNIDGKEVLVNFDKDGNTYIDEIPEGVENEDEFLEKIQRDSKVVELGRTLSKYKQKRTEQNLAEKENETLKRERQELQDKYNQSQKALEEFQQKAVNRKYAESGMKHETAYNKKLREILQVESEKEIDDISLDEPGIYRKAQAKANAYANEQVLRLQEKQNTLLFQKQNKINELNAIVRADNRFEPNEVIKFGDALGVSHWSAKDIYDYYKTKHSSQNLVDNENFLNAKRMSKTRILKPSRTSRNTGSLENMLLKEAQILIKNNPTDPRVIAYRKKQQL